MKVGACLLQTRELLLCNGFIAVEGCFEFKSCCGQGGNQDEKPPLSDVYETRKLLSRTPALPGPPVSRSSLLQTSLTSRKTRDDIEALGLYHRSYPLSELGGKIL